MTNISQRVKYRELYDIAKSQNPHLDIQLLFIIGTDEEELLELYDMPDKISGRGSTDLSSDRPSAGHWLVYSVNGYWIPYLSVAIFRYYNG